MRFFQLTSMGLILLLVPVCSRADDQACDTHEKERQKINWFYNLPDRSTLPPLEQVQSSGAFILVDEITKLGQDCAVTLVAEAGDKNSIDLLANFEVSAAFFTRAFIKGRVQYPD